MKRLIVICIAAMFMSIGSSAYAYVDLSALPSSPYEYDSLAGTTTDITKISFDYSYGDYTLPIGSAAFRIRRLNSNGTDSWLGSFNIFSTSFNLDTDYGPYSHNASLAGTNHYEFILNRSNGLWELSINGSLIDFYSLSSTTTPQPDGFTVSGAGVLMANKYFSDESAEAIQNAIDLGWAANAGDGVGGTGAYRLEFTGLPGATGAFVDNIEVTPIPAPAAILLGTFGAGIVGWMKRRKSL